MALFGEGYWVPSTDSPAPVLQSVVFVSACPDDAYTAQHSSDWPAVSPRILGIMTLFHPEAQVHPKSQGQLVQGEETVEEAEERLCVICLVNNRDTTVLPCRHMCMCHECAQVRLLPPCCCCQFAQSVALHRRELPRDVTCVEPCPCQLLCRVCPASPPHADPGNGTASLWGSGCHPAALHHYTYRPAGLQELRKQTSKCPICREQVDSLLHIKMQKTAHKVPTGAAAAAAAQKIEELKV